MSSSQEGHYQAIPVSATPSETGFPAGPSGSNIVIPKPLPSKNINLRPRHQPDECLEMWRKVTTLDEEKVVSLCSKSGEFRRWLRSLSRMVEGAPEEVVLTSSASVDDEDDDEDDDDDDEMDDDGEIEDAGDEDYVPEDEVVPSESNDSKGGRKRPSSSPSAVTPVKTHRPTLMMEAASKISYWKIQMMFADTPKPMPIKMVGSGTTPDEIAEEMKMLTSQLTLPGFASNVVRYRLGQEYIRLTNLEASKQKLEAFLAKYKLVDHTLRGYAQAVQVYDKYPTLLLVPDSFSFVKNHIKSVLKALEANSDAASFFALRHEWLDNMSDGALTISFDGTVQPLPEPAKKPKMTSIA